MEKFHFTTIVSKDHLYKFIVMYSSLEAHCNNFKIHVLCVNEVVYKILSTIGFKYIVLVKLEEIEDAKLFAAKKDRPFHAYCWTLKPVFLHYVVVNHPQAEYFAHLDSDLLFFDDPQLIFSENIAASLFLTHHRNSEAFVKFYDITGIYNTGFVGCKNDAIALEAIGQWKDKCIEYCPLKEDIEKKVFGDQRYVEVWPDCFPGVHIVESVGANAALWNITDYNVALLDDKVILNNTPLIFYHFSGLAVINSREYNICWYYHIDDQKIIDNIYVPYLISLQNCINEIKRYFPDFNEGFTKKEFIPNTHFYTLSN